MEITRFNMCTDTIHFKNDICLWQCTNGTDMVARGCEVGMRIIDRIINMFPPHILAVKGGC